MVSHAIGSEFHGVTDAAIVIRPLQAALLENGKISLSGSFGVFFSGRLLARFYDEHGHSLGTVPVMDVSPAEVGVARIGNRSSSENPRDSRFTLIDESGARPRCASGSAGGRPG